MLEYKTSGVEYSTTAQDEMWTEKVQQATSRSASTLLFNSPSNMEHALNVLSGRNETPHMTRKVECSCRYRTMHIGFVRVENQGAGGARCAAPVLHLSSNRFELRCKCFWQGQFFVQ